MEFNLDTGRLLVFMVGIVIFLTVESFCAARPQPDARWHRLGFHVGVAALNTIIVRVFAYVPFLLWSVYVEEKGWGLSRWLGLHGWTEILVSLFVLDGFDYFWHRANHRVRVLWRFHKAHHADREMDLTTSLRFHPGELLLSALVKALWIGVWGPSVIAWFIFEALVSLCAQFHHSNIDFPDPLERWLSLLVVTPRYHAAHHAVDRRWGDANFATIFSFWDRLFLSYEHPPAAGAVRLGLPVARELAFSPLAWLGEPFSRRNLHLSGRDSIAPREQDGTP
jgi:sterol desaturase/sphingolipid hydroxylase (fatty acid hydroxylase superfamily)